MSLGDSVGCTRSLTCWADVEQWVSVLAAHQSPLSTFNNHNAGAAPGPLHQDHGMRLERQGLRGGRCFLFLKLLSDSNVQLRQRATDLEAPNVYCREVWLVQETGSSYLTSSMIVRQSSLQIVSALTWTVFNLQDAGMGKKSWLPQGVPCSNITLYCVGNGLRFRFPSGEKRVWWWIISFQNTEFLYKSGDHSQRTVSQYSPPLLRPREEFFSSCWNSSSSLEMPLAINKQWLENRTVRTLGPGVSIVCNCGGVTHGTSGSDFARLQIINGWGESWWTKSQTLLLTNVPISKAIHIAFWYVIFL